MTLIKPEDCLKFDTCKYKLDGGCFDGCDFRVEKQNLMPCPICKIDEFSFKADGIYCWNCGKLLYRWVGDEVKQSDPRELELDRQGHYDDEARFTEAEGDTYA